MGFLRLFLIVVGLAFLGALTGTGLYLGSRQASPVSQAPIPVSIGGAAFLIPPAFVRAGALPRPGQQEQVDMVVMFPDFGPPQAEAGNTSQIRIFIALLREDGIIDPAERVNEIYGRFLEPDIWQNPGGLLLRRFGPDSPYADEELYISPPDGRAFHARCRKSVPRRDGGRSGDIGEMCLWRFRIGGADALVRFPPELLPQWENMATGLRSKIAAWRGK